MPRVQSVDATLVEEEGQPLRVRPSLDRIVRVVAEQFRCAPGGWPAGTRSYAIGRAAAAYLGRDDDSDIRWGATTRCARHAPATLDRVGKLFFA